MSDKPAAPHDWTINVKKYVSNADEAAIHGIVKHLGIALHGKDSSFVACTDKKERDLVRDHFLKKSSVLRWKTPHSIRASWTCAGRCTTTAISRALRSITCSRKNSESYPCSTEPLAL
jgi:hypothetical protein